MEIERHCDNCGCKYKADERNLKRGWGLCCSKSCAATKREKSKPGYDPLGVAINNERRENWATNREEDAIEALGMDFLLDCGDR